MLEVLPLYGFDIGLKAVKVDDRVAEQIVKRWKYIRRDLEEKKKKEQEEKLLKERVLRKELGHVVNLPKLITVREFSERMNLPVSQVIMELMKNGILANQNQNIDFDTASVIAGELGFRVEKEIQTKGSIEDVFAENVEEKAVVQCDDPNATPRPPVIVVMGHVDHGKTKLLDTIRSTNVVDKEAGGITQHIGAYQTVWKDPKTKAERALTFIDTPGHEAFSMMRSRGAKVADIAILIVAADDGVKPQTEEAINIIRAARLPMVAAINKIDKESADLDRVKTELSQKNVIPEEWGGDVPTIGISAKSKLNIDQLLDLLLLVADVNSEKIKANPNKPALGTIIESHVDKGMGPVATVLIQAGTLHRGDKLAVNGEIYGTVRAMKDYKGDLIDIASPSVPVQIIGFKVAPEVGDILDVGKADKAVKIDVKQKRNLQTGSERTTVISAEQHEEEGTTNKKTLNLLIKADVLGSLEAIINSLSKIKHDEVGVKIIGKGLGNIIENDVTKAEAGSAILVGFNVNPTPATEVLLKEKGITFLQYKVIYDLINWVKEELEKMLDKEKIVTEIGNGKVLAIFRKEKSYQIVGVKITNGKVMKDCLVRIKRGGLMINIGKIAMCKVGQQEVKDVYDGAECGVQLEVREKIEIEDELEFYNEETKTRKIIFQ